MVATIRQTRLKSSNVLYRLACTVYEYVSLGIFSITVLRMYTKMMLYFWKYKIFLNSIFTLIKKIILKFWRKEDNVQSADWAMAKVVKSEVRLD